MYTQLPITPIRQSMIKTPIMTTTLTSFPAGLPAGAGEPVKEEPVSALMLFVSAGIDVRFTADKLLLSEDDFFVDSLDSEQINICATLKLKQQARELARNHGK